MSEQAVKNKKSFECPHCGCGRLRSMHTDRKPGFLRRVRECVECGARVECQEKVIGIIERYPSQARHKPIHGVE
jgi:transcription elongation factor Elf1